MEDDLVKDGAMMSEAERNKLERDIRNLQREIRRAQEEFREDLNVRRNEELGKIQRQVIEVIRVLAENEEYDLIVSDGVLFAGERVDITDEVLSLLHGEFAQSDKKDSENDN
jgi:outer membrane protein